MSSFLHSSSWSSSPPCPSPSANILLFSFSRIKFCTKKLLATVTTVLINQLFGVLSVVLFIGPLLQGRSNLTHEKERFAHEHPQMNKLEDVVRELKPTAIIGKNTSNWCSHSPSVALDDCHRRTALPWFSESLRFGSINCFWCLCSEFNGIWHWIRHCCEQLDVGTTYFRYTTMQRKAYIYLTSQLST